MTAPRAGGETGSKAGLSGSTASGPGVDGVDCGAHFVPKPRVTDEGLCTKGVVGVVAAGGPELVRLAAFGVTACLIMCSGIAGRGAWVAVGLGVTEIGVPVADCC